MLKDRNDRRTGIERRQFDYTACIPDRRSGIDRRREINRLSGLNPEKLKALRFKKNSV
jgi:hypothetical protein